MVIGILAHVDAGKTTLAESMLYLSGSIRKLGRVDHKDAFLDTYELERNRGITIFSKQAVFELSDTKVTLLDTPGHVDFSAEMERTLQVLDYAILVISGSDGVQGHTETLWSLLKRHGIPTFLFVNKMDLQGSNRKAMMEELKKRLDDGCVDFNSIQEPDVWMENLAMCDETLLDSYMENGFIAEEDVTALVADRKVFPCYFGSALKLDGIEELLHGLERYTKQSSYPTEFGAKIFKITRNEQGNRLTFMKITGGSLKVKTSLTNRKELNKDGDTTVWEEKVDQIRIYSGTRYEKVDEVEAGTICAVTGLNKTFPGEGLGIEATSDNPVLEPVLNYQILLPPGCDAFMMFSKLRQLVEEDPQLHIVWSKQLREIHVQLMGEVQVEILKSIIKERFGIDVEFGSGNIVYRESILEPVEGVGHYEPLRHYAEVHLLLEPGEPGSGLTFYSKCSEDVLDRNWQRLILGHLGEKEHVGVLTGAPITDMKITLLGGRAHQKHTEGGDFRQATYRAVRQGLKKAKCILLEPYYLFKLELPSEFIGRAMSDIQRMYGEFSPPENNGDTSVLTGVVPVATIQDYQMEVTSYTKGRGRISLRLKGYEPCHNEDEVLLAFNYDSEQDLDHPTSSVFCAHGSGFVVEWDKVQDYMHVESLWKAKEIEKSPVQTKSFNESRKSSYDGTLKEDKELEDIFIRTFGPIKRRQNPAQSNLGYEKRSDTVDNIQRNPRIDDKRKEALQEYLLVDGYNIIFSWSELNELAEVNMDAARTRLMDILCNYQGFKQCIVILVFDAYKVKGGIGEIIDYHNIHVVFTKEAETADQYIEKTTHEIARKHHVTVATSDALEQLIIMGQGAFRLSADGLKEEINRVREQMQKEYLDKQPISRSYLKQQMSNDLWEISDSDIDIE